MHTIPAPQGRSSRRRVGACDRLPRRLRHPRRRVLRARGEVVGAQIAIMAVGGELIGYWLHRLAHRGALWSFHKLHHSSEDLDWLSAVRVHPIDDILRRMVHIVVLFAVGFDFTLVAGVAPVMALYAVLLHA